MFRTLNHDKAELCHQLHYLQMATEKMAKAFLTNPSAPQRPKRVHQALVKYIRAAKRMPQVKQACGIPDWSQFRSYLDGLLTVADAVEALAPVGALDKPNPEYPWESGGVIICPKEYQYSYLEWRSPRMRKFVKFIEISIGMS
jgi:hypothetical protein